MMADRTMYDEWIASRRAAKPPRDLTDRVMAAVEDRNVPLQSHVSLANQLNESRPARWAACLAALLVGSLPFLFVAHAAKFFIF